jgi:hypothetical protein
MALMIAFGTLEHCHFHVLLIVFGDYFVAVFAQLFFVFDLHVFIIRLSSFSLVFAHELIDVVDVDLLLITSKLITRIDLHFFIFFFFLWFKLRFLLSDLTTASDLSSTTDLTTANLATVVLLLILSCLGNKCVEDNFHIVDFKLV